MAIAFRRSRRLREGDTPHGLFTLTFRRFDGTQVIIIPTRTSIGP